ncbi:MAG: hypothetical protein DWI29_00535 [Planctomycetota bacterium]|nr:MAG: hypothetical protein DWI29_00535 [Planctomycetota bacterium]
MQVTQAFWFVEIGKRESGNSEREIVTDSFIHLPAPWRVIVRSANSFFTVDEIVLYLRVNRQGTAVDSQMSQRKCGLWGSTTNEVGSAKYSGNCWKSHAANIAPAP